MKRAIYLFLKRFTDLLLSMFGLMLASPILLPVLFLVWKQDKYSPFYIAERVGKNFKLFQMVKLRSMILNADNNGVDSTSNNDQRITPIGHKIRKYKLDEVAQLWNVLKGEMSLVGPRPNVRREIDLYTKEEKMLLSVKPGITDFASIVFSDEGSILSGKADPDLVYNQLIRPGKSQLGLLYVTKNNLLVDFALLFITLISLISRAKALSLNLKLLKWSKAPKSLLDLASRKNPLVPSPPPGATSIVVSRDLN